MKQIKNHKRMMDEIKEKILLHRLFANLKRDLIIGNALSN